MYALYFKKDQVLRWIDPFGHRHDWEFALVWTTNGQPTHASYSAHHDVETWPKAALHFDPGMNNTVKIVYHKSFLSTHAFRLAKPQEKAKNDLKRWLTPPIVDWHTMHSEFITNEELRSKFNQFDYGDATCQFNDTFFEKRIAKNPPPGYPF